MPDNKELSKNRLIKKKDQHCDDESEDSDKEMMDFMASCSGAEKSTKRRARDPCSRPMSRAARIKLELKMEASAEGPDSDEEMMALLGRGDEGGCGGGGGAPAAQGIGQRIKAFS